jgi:hypothetical protein
MFLVLDADLFVPLWGAICPSQAESIHPLRVTSQKPHYSGRVVSFEHQAPTTSVKMCQAQD